MLWKIPFTFLEIQKGARGKTIANDGVWSQCEDSVLMAFSAKVESERQAAFPSYFFHILHIFRASWVCRKATSAPGRRAWPNDSAPLK